MKKVSTVIARPIVVKSNVIVKANPDWMQIKDAVSGEILHTGRPAYIRKVALNRYNAKVS